MKILKMEEKQTDGRIKDKHIESELIPCSNVLAQITYKNLTKKSEINDGFVVIKNGKRGIWDREVLGVFDTYEEAVAYSTSKEVQMKIDPYDHVFVREIDGKGNNELGKWGIFSAKGCVAVTEAYIDPFEWAMNNGNGQDAPYRCVPI